MAKKELIIITDASQPTIDLEEICHLFNIDADMIYNLVEYDIIHPKNRVSQEWLFDIADLKRIKTALRLQHDFEMNLQSVAVVLQLLDEMENLRIQLEVLEKHFTKLS